MKLTYWQLAMALLIMAPAHATSALHEESRTLGLPRCPVSQTSSPEMGPAVAILLKAIAPTLVEQSIDLAAAAATAAGQDQQSKPVLSSFQGNFYAYSNSQLALNRVLGCLVIMRGTFGDQAVEPDEHWAKAGIASVARLTGLVNNPGLYLEATLEPSIDRSYFRLVPQYFIYKTPIEDSLWRSSTRGVNVALSFSLPGTEKPFASTAFSFPNVEPKSEYSSAYLAGYRSNWMPLPAPSDRTTTLLKDEIDHQNLLKKNMEDLQPPLQLRPRGALDKDLAKAQAELCAIMEKKSQTDSSCPRDIVEKKAQILDFLAQQQAADNQWLAERQKEQLAKWEQDRAVQLKKASDEKKVNPLDELQPFNLDVTITETAPGSAFLKFIGSVLNGAKADLVAEAKTKAESYTPAEKSKAADDLNTLYADAATKKAAVEGQILKINAESDENKKAVLALDLPQLKIQANGAFRKAGLTEPYPGVTP